MELSEILEKMKEPEKLLEPGEMVNISQHISQFITDYELQYDEAKIAYSFRWEEIKYAPTLSEKSIAKARTDKQTEIAMMRDPAYERLNKIKRTLGELKRYRSDLNRRMDVIMNIRRHNN